MHVIEVNKTTSTIAINIPLQMNWKPKEDITAYELAMCLPYLSRINSVMPYEIDLSDIKDNHFRHFEIIDPNIGD